MFQSGERQIDVYKRWIGLIRSCSFAGLKDCSWKHLLFLWKHVFRVLSSPIFWGPERCNSSRMAPNVTMRAGTTTGSWSDVRKSSFLCSSRQQTSHFRSGAPFSWCLSFPSCLFFLSCPSSPSSPSCSFSCRPFSLCPLFSHELCLPFELDPPYRREADAMQSQSLLKVVKRMEKICYQTSMKNITCFNF